VTWRAGLDVVGAPRIQAVFSRTDCGACAAHELCTPVRSLPPASRTWSAKRGAGVDARPAWNERYRVRAGIEGTLSQGVRAFGMRQSRYIGLTKTGLQQACTTAAMNVSRIVNWLDGMPRTKTRVTCFTALAQAAPALPFAGAQKTGEGSLAAATALFTSAPEPPEISVKLSSVEGLITSIHLTSTGSTQAPSLKNFRLFDIDHLPSINSQAYSEKLQLQLADISVHQDGLGRIPLLVRLFTHQRAFVAAASAHRDVRGGGLPRSYLGSPLARHCPPAGLVTEQTPIVAKCRIISHPNSQRVSRQLSSNIRLNGLK